MSVPAHTALNDPHAPPCPFNGSDPKQPFLFPWMKKVLKGKHFAHVKEVKQKTTEALKGIKSTSSKAVLRNG